MELISNPKVKSKFETYPEPVKERLLYIRELILNTAKQIDGLSSLEETLKWGEPSYLTKKGSTIRINKKKDPKKFAIYFSCSTSLVATFRIVFKNAFTFEDNRAIVFELSEEIPEEELRQCISAALKYHKIKHLPLLGM